MSFFSNQSVKLYLYSAVWILGALSIYASALTKLNALHAKAEKVEAAETVRGNTESFRVALKAAMDHTALDRARLESHFVRKDGVVEFINGLEDLGRSEGLVTNINSLSESWQEGNSGSLMLSLKVSGSFSAIYQYLLLLQELPQKMRITSVQFAAGQSGAPATLSAVQGNSSSVWSADIQALVVHYIK